MKSKTALKIELYSDVICPWCWLGKRRLEKALSQFPQIKAELHYLPYELNPSTPEEGIDRVKYLTSKYGGAIPAMDARLTALGLEDGLHYRFERAARIPNTLRAHRVIWLASKEGAAGPVTEALHRAYFELGKDIGNKEALVEVAALAGLDESKTRKLLEGNQGEVEVRALEEQGYNLGITGVPFFIFNGESAVSGAQPVESFASILGRMDGST